MLILDAPPELTVTDYVISLSPSFACVHPVCNFKNRTQSQSTQFEEMKENGIRNGVLSKSAISKIKKSVNYLVWLASRKPRKWRYQNKDAKTFLSFVTLTLPAPQFHPDTEIKEKVLQPFLQALRDKYNLKYYIWKAELQKNENIHFHLTTDIYIPHQAIRKIWNYYLNRIGYIDRFFAKFGHHNPPTTEIKSVKNIKNLGAYLIKYLCKDTEKATVQNKKDDQERYIHFGKYYSISLHLSAFKNLSFDWGMDAYQTFIDYFQALKLKTISDDFYTLYLYSIDIFNECLNALKRDFGIDFFRETPYFEFMKIQT